MKLVKRVKFFLILDNCFLKYGKQFISGYAETNEYINYETFYSYNVQQSFFFLFFSF